jgi:hypothetical protein
MNITIPVSSTTVVARDRGFETMVDSSKGVNVKVTWSGFLYGVKQPLRYEVALGVTAQGDQIRPFTAVSASTLIFTFNGVSVPLGDNLYATVRAVYSPTV